MVLRQEIKDMIEARLLLNKYLLEEDDEYIKYTDREEHYGSKLEAVLDEEEKKLLDEFVAALDRKHLIEQILGYIVGSSDTSKMKNIYDEIK